MTALWFCIGCINRFAQGLSISLLELSTLGHAFCTLFIYAMWWHKPLDVGEPEKISFDASLTGEDLLNASKIVATMCVKSKLDNKLSEFKHFNSAGLTKSFKFNVEYKYLEQTASFGCRINKDVTTGSTHFSISHTTPEQKPFLLHSLVYPPLMQKYAFRKEKYVNKIPPNSRSRKQQLSLSIHNISVF